MMLAYNLSGQFFASHSCPATVKHAVQQSNVVMTACMTLPRSSARTGPLRWAHWRLINRYASTRALPRNPASPIIPESDENKEHPSFRVDKENKTVTTAIGDLPLSPIMDPSYWEATTRHQTPKAKASKAQNSVERQFRKSAFANALGTPIRQCTASHIRLPTFFLQDFKLIAHPKTQEPWWVPRSFAREKPVKSKKADTAPTETPTDEEDFSDEQMIAEADQEDADNQESYPEEEIPSEVEETDTQEPDTQGPPPEEETRSIVQEAHTAANGPGAYVMARQDLIASFTEPGSSFSRHHRTLFGGSSSRFTKFASRAVWRKDMDTFILDLMRTDIIDEVNYLSQLCIEDDRHYIAKYDTWEDIQNKRDGAILWFGDVVGSEADSQQPESGPGPFAVYDTKNESGPTSVAVHNMPMLLGAEEAAKLKQEAAVLAEGTLFMITGRRTVDLQLRLWKLQGYLADHR
ncbi:hypothetical protein GGR50DRAFT_487959 [Xylaria sp. CBS 124048]|nr:hypothetical protein GGR50DRAFT_487959 [Xylaria sp. CBS 124048]